MSHMRSESVMGMAGVFGVEEGLVVQEVAVVRSFSYLLD